MISKKAKSVTMTEAQKTIQTLEQDYKQQRNAFEKWKEENAHMSEHESYAQYVEQFRTWEKTVVEKLKQLRASVTRQPVAPAPELPMVDLDTQLDTVLQEVNAPQFIMAFMTMAQKDPTFLKKAFEVVMEECRGTGFTNPILPQGIHASRSTPAFGGYRQPTAMATGGSAIQSASSPGPNAGLYLPAQPQSYLAGSTLLTPRYAGTPPTASTSSFVQGTPYGMIPEGWAVDPAIRKQPKPASPMREYRTPMNLPFKDFSQN